MLFNSVHMLYTYFFTLHDKYYIQYSFNTQCIITCWYIYCGRGYNYNIQIIQLFISVCIYYDLFTDKEMFVFNFRLHVYFPLFHATYLKYSMSRLRYKLLFQLNKFCKEF